MAGLRSSFRQLLFVFVLAVVLIAFRDYRKSSLHHWYDHARSLVETSQPDQQRYYEAHHVRQDGVLEVNMAGRHPLLDLMEDAERRMQQRQARQSKTLAEAVNEYTRRNGYAPPAGFDLWWNFVRRHDVKLVDEFDQINYDITPYLALSPATFRARVDALADPTKGFHINVTNGHLGQYGPLWWNGDQRELASMLMAFSPALPDLELHGSAKPHGDQWIGDDLRREAAAKARAGQYFTDDELRSYEQIERNEHRDLKNTCLPDDLIFNAAPFSDAPTFIASHLTVMSPCSNPSAHRIPPFLFMPRAQPLRLTPHFVFSKHRPDSGFLLPTNTWESYDPLLVVPHTWAERRDESAGRLFWRGTSTGWHWSKSIMSSEPGITWRNGSRAKLAFEFGAGANPIREQVEVLMEAEGGDGGLVMRKFDRAWLNEQWMDVGLTGSPIQCNRHDGTCDEMRQALVWKEPVNQRKANREMFSLDVDSNAWSGEFQRKLSWGNVVLKSTLYPEWNTQWLIPYYHYIPIQADYSDVYNVMAFFLGDPERGTGAHEEMAEKISRQASKFVREHWRWQDMQAYLYRLMLEYARLGNDDREAASFRLARDTD